MDVIKQLKQHSKIVRYSLRVSQKFMEQQYEVSNFNNDIASNYDFKFFKHKAKLLGNVAADRANGILRNTTISKPLKYLGNFWISLE